MAHSTQHTSSEQAQTPAPLSSLPHYSTPPIIMREFRMLIEVPVDVFASIIEPLKNELKEKLPHLKQETSVELSMPSFENGLPDLRNAKQKLYFIQRFSSEEKHTGYKKHVPVVECVFTPLSDTTLELKLKHHAHARPNERYSFFKDYALYCTHLVARLLPESKVTEVSLAYYNLLSRATTPTIVTNEHGFAPGKWLTVFADIPGEYESLIPPYLYKTSLVISTKDNLIVDIEVKGPPQQIANAPFLQVVIAGKKRQINQAARDVAYDGILDLLHHQIGAFFETIFTAEAKLAFGPNTQQT